ncbi:MAG: hypothetical protein ACXW32_07015 [Limisphaerales bacterium]
MRIQRWSAVVALLDVPKVNRSAICFKVSVVSLRRRGQRQLRLITLGMVLKFGGVPAQAREVFQDDRVSSRLRVFTGSTV